MSSSPPQRTSLCIFGATGFTGKRVAMEIATQINLFHQATSPNKPFTWSIAGRSKTSLEKVRQDIKTVVGASTASGSDTTNIAKGLLPSLVEADVNNADSLREMAKGSKLILNCVGPYAHLGEGVVVAVLEATEQNRHDPTHYIDLCGEPNFIERMVLKYRSRAISLGCAIVPASAFDSVPSDMGVVFSKAYLGTETIPASVEMVFEMHSKVKVAAHYATYASAVHGFSPPARKMLSSTRKELYGTLPRVTPLAKGRGLPLGLPKRKKVLGGMFTYDEETSSYLLPFFFADPAVVRLSQALMAEQDKDFRPVQFVSWLAVPNAIILVTMAAYFLVFSLFCKYEYGRKLLLDHPKFFTAGVFSHEGPTKEQLQATSFTTTLTAAGHSRKIFEAGDRRQEPDVRKVIKIRGPEPGYISTPILFVAVARTILQEEEKVHKGVSVPAAALCDTSIIKMLNEDGRVTFKNVT